MLTDATLEDLRVLLLAEVEQLVGLKKTAIYNHIKAGDFPAPRRLGHRKVGWSVVDIRAWLQAPERHWDPNDS